MYKFHTTYPDMNPEEVKPELEIKLTYFLDNTLTEVKRVTVIFWSADDPEKLNLRIFLLNEHNKKQMNMYLVLPCCKPAKTIPTSLSSEHSLQQERERKNCLDCH